MPHEPQRVAETRSWFAKAGGDLRASDVLLATTPPLLGDAVFHCQQAAEKAIKGFLAWNDVAFRRTHDLAELGGQCVDLDASLENLCRRAERLTVFAWVFRYPGEPAEPTRAEADEALATAREVVEALLARLPDEVRP